MYSLDETVVIHEDMSKRLLLGAYIRKVEIGEDKILFLAFHIHASLYSYSCAQSIYTSVNVPYSSKRFFLKSRIHILSSILSIHDEK